MSQDKINQHVHFSERLRQAIEKSGLNKRVIADKVGVDPTVISRWLRQSFPESRYLARLASVLNVSVPWLISGGPADAPAILQDPDGFRYHVPAPSRSTVQELPPRSDPSADPVADRLRVMLARVQEDAAAMVTSPPERRAKLAEMARSHITHFLLWLESTECPDPPEA